MENDFPRAEYAKSYMRIDPKVRSLVYAINNFGIRTYGSCEGHMNMRRHRHPWVSLHTDGNIKLLDYGIEEFNRVNFVQWERRPGTIESSTLQPLTYLGMCIYSCSETREEATQEKLNELRVSADMLAEFLNSLRG